MIPDRLFFEKTFLPNGITVWSHPLDTPFAQVRVVLPVGNSHSHTQNYSGSAGIAHFLEHSCFERSHLFPIKDSFEQAVAKTGGDWNAWTQAFTTTYYLQAPHDDFDNLFPGFLSHIFEPIFKQGDIDIQKGIIRNEQQQQKYYPADNELNYYKFTEWAEARFVPKQQVYGAISDIESISSEQLQQFHTHYFGKPTTVIIGGTYNRDVVHSLLSEIKTTEIVPQPLFLPYEWKKRDFHMVHISDIDAPHYAWGNFIPHCTIEEYLGIAFICEYLTNHQRGVLNKTFRKDRGYSYGVTSTQWCDRQYMGWTIDVPLNDRSAVEAVRNEIHSLSQNALCNDDEIKETRERIINSRCFAFQTLSERIDVVTEAILTFGSNFTEQQYVEWLREHTDSESLKMIYNKYFTPVVSGEFLALPPKIDSA